MNWELAVESGIKALHRHSQFWGWHKVVPLVAYWMYLIHIQLGFLGLRDIRRKEFINEIGSLVCPCCCCYWRVASETSALGGVVHPKRLCLAAYSISAARERRSGLNGRGHPDWVKLCVELNCAPNQNTFCYNFTFFSSKQIIFKFHY